MSMKTAVVVGGGLVGSLSACFLAKEGFMVDLYEQREDPRITKVKSNRSINLALSHRGKEALRYVGLEDLVLSQATPMKGRLIHFRSGEKKSFPYDKHNNQCIYSISRSYLNNVLLTASEKNPNVNLHFNHKLTQVDLQKSTLTFQKLDIVEAFQITADLILAADGAHSFIRNAMQQLPLFEFSQTYIDHGYIELNIPPEKGATMISNHLHIWPRGTFMMIALPNGDGSWNVILFMPFAIFSALNTSAQLLTFFEETFTDALDLLGAEALCETFFKTQPSHLVSIKCSPYHCGRFLLLGDAAHAMVPFYGQGMNAGFEDCIILKELLHQNDFDIMKALEDFSAKRRDDAYAICDLAMYNYVEMRDLVAKRWFRVRKTCDEVLYVVMPKIWAPLYHSVTFSRMSYGDCKRSQEWQNQVIHKIVFGFISLCVLVFVAFLYVMVF